MVVNISCFLKAYISVLTNILLKELSIRPVTVVYKYISACIEMMSTLQLPPSPWRIVTILLLLMVCTQSEWSDEQLIRSGV